MALGPRLLEALERVHELGIRHGDCLHEGNMLVTPEDEVILLDFGMCQLDAPDWRLDQEHKLVAHTLSLKYQVRRPVLTVGSQLI